jgi:cob(I)alamin adenosyltransferase
MVRTSRNIEGGNGMRIYTRTGDKGQTSIIGGRVEKDDIRVHAYGTVDEVNSFVGQAMTELTPETFSDILAELEKIQHELFDCGGDLSTIEGKRPYKVTKDMVTFLEERIDSYIEEAPELERFILPGGSKASAIVHLARTITRRAERHIVTLAKVESINEIALQYVNRLSDYFFALARVINAREGVKDVEYERSAIVFRDGKRKES